MTQPRKYRKKPVEIEAMQWDGVNSGPLTKWTGALFFPLSDEERMDCDDPEATAQVFDNLHSTWVLVYTGDWIIRGVKGEFYPCRNEVFEETYESVDFPQIGAVTARELRDRG